jgi:hypothetical protein
MSNVPPGGTGTTRRIGLFGYVSACASRDMAGEPAALATKCRNFRRPSFMYCAAAEKADQFRVGFPLAENRFTKV